MVNNKKNKSAKKAAKEPSAAEIGPSPTEMSNSPEGKSHLSMGQFTCSIFLVIGFTYVLQFASVIKDGIGSKACTSYVPKAEGGCSEMDIAIMTSKYHFAAINIALVSSLTLFCWTREGLLLRLLAFLLTSPLLTSVMAIQVAKELSAHPTELFKLGMMITALLVGAACAIYKNEISSRLPFSLNLQNSTLFMIVLAESYEIWKFMTAGVSGYMQGEVTPASEVILAFLCVDHATVTLLAVFAAFFLPNNPKRSFLFVLAVAYFINLRYCLPTIKPKLADAEYAEQLLLGSAMFCLTAALAPEVTFMTEPKQE